MDNKRSPLKGKPLRQAGQSVQEQIDYIIDEKFTSYIFGSVILICFAGYEWLKWFNKTPPSPVVISIFAVGVTLYSAIQIYRLRGKVKSLKQGRDGEKAVGQFLELLREDGCIVFHDILGDKFNIDHVVISEKGIYCIETKTYSKPNKGDPKIHFDGEHLTIDSIGNKDEVLKQVEAECHWLKEMLKDSTGKEFNIKPVVLFPGWYIESNNHSKHWVLNPKALPKFIENQKIILNKEDVKLAAYHLSRYIRAL